MNRQSNVGAKAKCVDAKGLEKRLLTEGDWYEILEEFPTIKMIRVLADNGKERDFKTERFEITPIRVLQ